MMPGIDGLELTRRLRANPTTPAMPIIMLTAKGLTVDKVIGLTAGADDYMVKPFDTMELVARIRSTLRRTKEFRESSPLTGLPGNTRILHEIDAPRCPAAKTSPSGTSTSTDSRPSTTCTVSAAATSSSWRWRARSSPRSAIEHRGRRRSSATSAATTS